MIVKTLLYFLFCIACCSALKQDAGYDDDDDEAIYGYTGTAIDEDDMEEV